LIKSSSDLIKFHSVYSSGFLRSKHDNNTTPVVDLFPTTSLHAATSLGGHNKPRPPPPPAFLVPAIIDALRSSPRYGHVVHLVPGEADGFCAKHVREHGGTIFTSDSDLLVYDLTIGDTDTSASVVFLPDIELDSTNNRLVAPVYKPEEICRRLGMKAEKDIFSRLAFEFSMDQYLTVMQAAEKVRRKAWDDLEEQEYMEFMEQYLAPEVVRELEGQMSGLDPRVSELVFQAMTRKEAAFYDDDGGSEDLEDGEVTMYLPFLLDCPVRTSAWQASTPVRQLAYAVLRSVRDEKGLEHVFEMRKLQSKSSGLRVEVPAPGEAEELAEGLLAILLGFEKVMENKELVWVMLAVYQDILMVSGRGKGTPLSLEVLGQLAKGALDAGSWEFLHLLAEVQATYYSLRMLRQVLEFASKHAPGSESPMASRLAEWVSRIPSLAEFPTPSTFEQMLQGVLEPASLECLAGLFEEDEGILPLITALGKPKKGTNGTPKKKKPPPSPEEGNQAKVRLPSGRVNNMFELLGVCGEED
jgi:hypothetical protein